MDDISTQTPFGDFTLAIGNDAAEAQQMQPFAQDQGSSWWQNLISYGATKAIDNRFGPTNIAGNMLSGTFAGADGRTYVIRPNAAGGSAQVAVQDNSLLILLLIGGVALLALKAG